MSLNAVLERVSKSPARFEINVSLLFFIVASLLVSINTEQVCKGLPMEQFDYEGTPEERLMNLEKRYTNCTMLDGSLELTGLPTDAEDLPFLHSLKEVTGYILVYRTYLKTLPLHNLELIGGKIELVLSGPSNRFNHYALCIKDNQELQYLRLRNLLEITVGTVVVSNNSNLCYDRRIYWGEMLRSDPAQVVLDYRIPYQEEQCPCHSACFEQYSVNISWCWGPDEEDCQLLLKGTCKVVCNNKCYNRGRDCCPLICRGKCTGDTGSDCHACRFARDDGVCVGGCPNPFDQSTRKVKYKYGLDCINKCPDFTYLDFFKCVHKCDDGSTALNGTCHRCNGQCPKECAGTGAGFLSKLNIERFRDCVIVDGSLYITSKGFDTSFHGGLRYSDLYRLRSVVVVEGSLAVDANSTEFRDLNFLSQLKRVMGNDFANHKQGLFIEDSSLEMLGLSSLERVAQGRVVIRGNKNLCYMEYMTMNHVVKKKEFVTIEDNKKFRDCESEMKVCDPACEGGCHGPEPSVCIRCKNFRLGVSCQKCHELCLRCSDSTATDCSQCAYARDYLDDFQTKFECVAKCPRDRPARVRMSGGPRDYYCTTRDMTVLEHTSSATFSPDVETEETTLMSIFTLDTKDWVGQPISHKMKVKFFKNPVEDKLSIEKSSSEIPLLIAGLAAGIVALVGIIFSMIVAAKRFLSSARAEREQRV